MWNVVAWQACSWPVVYVCGKGRGVEWDGVEWDGVFDTNMSEQPQGWCGCMLDRHYAVATVTSMLTEMRSPCCWVLVSASGTMTLRCASPLLRTGLTQ